MTRFGPLPISEAEIRGLCLKSRQIFLEQPMLIEIDAPVKVCGDIHGQYKDLLRLFELTKHPPHSKFLFLGDYVDRGKYSLATLCLLLAYKIKHPKIFYILRGNHESSDLNRVYGFFDECCERYNENLWKTIVKDCFNVLPVAAIIQKKIFCCHGGLSPDLHSMDQIRGLPRPSQVPHSGLMCDLLWADPARRGLDGWHDNTERGLSFTFGADVVTEFLDRHDLDMIARAHEVVQEGYEFFAAKQLVTVFSAPNYTGTYNNAGAIMLVERSLRCSFQILQKMVEALKTLVPSFESQEQRLCLQRTVGHELKIAYEIVTDGDIHLHVIGL